MPRAPQLVLDTYVSAIKTRFKPDWDKGLAQLLALKDQPFESWPTYEAIGDVDADVPEDPFTDLTAGVNAMREAWEAGATEHFERLNYIGKRHLLVAGGLQTLRWRVDGDPIPLEHTQGATWMIWLQSLGIMETIGFDLWEDLGADEVEEEAIEEEE